MRSLHESTLALVLLTTCVAGAAVQDPPGVDDKEAARRAERARLQMRVREAEELVRRAEIEEQFGQIDQLIFQPDGNAVAARKRLDALLTAQIEEINRACQLSEAQKRKLLLAGRGEVSRFFDRYEVIKQKLQMLERNQQNLLQVHQEASPLRMSLQAGLFHEESLLYKALPRTLTEEQFARYERMAGERRATRHRASIETAIKTLERNKPLRAAQRQELATLLTKETRPLRRSSPYESYYILIQMGRLPEEKLQALIGETHWNDVSRLLEQYKAAEPRLRESGMLPAEDDEADRIGAPQAGRR